MKTVKWIFTSVQVWDHSANLVPGTLAGQKAESVQVEAVPCTHMSMAFFDRLYDGDIVRESGQIRKCFDEFFEDFTISDELRKVCELLPLDCCFLENRTAS